MPPLPRKVGYSSRVFYSFVPIMDTNYIKPRLKFDFLLQTSTCGQLFFLQKSNFTVVCRNFFFKNQINVYLKRHLKSAIFDFFSTKSEKLNNIPKKYDFFWVYFMTKKIKFLTSIIVVIFFFFADIIGGNGKKALIFYARMICSFFCGF